MNRLKELREESNMSQAKLGVLLGCAGPTVSKYELEQRALDPEMISRLCGIFNCTSDYLLGFSNQKSPVLSEDEYALLSAYRAAPKSIREGIDVLLAPYKEEENQSSAVG